MLCFTVCSCNIKPYFLYYSGLLTKIEEARQLPRLLYQGRTAYKIVIEPPFESYRLKAKKIFSVRMTARNTRFIDKS